MPSSNSLKRLLIKQSVPSIECTDSFVERTFEKNHR